MESPHLDHDHNHHHVRDLHLAVGLDQHDEVVVNSVHPHHAPVFEKRTELFRDALRHRP